MVDAVACGDTGPDSCPGHRGHHRAGDRTGGNLRPVQMAPQHGDMSGCCDTGWLATAALAGTDARHLAAATSPASCRQPRSSQRPAGVPADAPVVIGPTAPMLIAATAAPARRSPG